STASRAARFSSRQGYVRKYDVTAVEQPAGALPVLLVVDVEALRAVGEIRCDDFPLACAGLRDDTCPRDLERAVLHVDRRQCLVLAGVPGDVEVGLVEQRPHRL